MISTTSPSVMPSFWKAVREACDRHGTLLIMDEIPTGLGKTGAMFAFEHDGIVPDIVTLGKALGGGILPIAAVVARRDLDVCGEFAIGHYTHEKNPVTARAALNRLTTLTGQAPGSLTTTLAPQRGLPPMPARQPPLHGVAPPAPPPMPPA